MSDLFRSLRFLVIVLLLTVVVSGCGSSGFVGSRVSDFRAYFNTFYNARKAFAEGMQALEDQERPVDDWRLISTHPVPVEPGGGEAFERAISKSADVLRKHPNSAWVDEALMLIGKSYFYRGNQAAAEQKFREVVEFGGEYQEEAHFWAARTLAASGQAEDALAYVASALRREEISGRWGSEALLLEGTLHARAGELDAAREALREGLAGDPSDDAAARAWFLLGQVAEMQGDYEAAANAYGEVEEETADFELEYAAQKNELRARGLYLNDENALRGLRAMERNNKYYDRRSELMAVRGQVLRALGQPGEAREVLRELLYDMEGIERRTQGFAHYELAETYREQSSLSLAAAHYDTAATMLRQESLVESYPSVSAVVDAEDRREVYVHFAEAMQRVERADSLLGLGALSDEAFRDTVLAMRRMRAEELERIGRRETDRGMRASTFRDDRRGLAVEASGAAESGFLFDDDPVGQQRAMQAFVERWGTRPLTPNWRRREALQMITTREGEEGGRVAAEEGRAARLPVIDVSAVPRSISARRDMELERARGEYQVASSLFLQVNRPDSAAVWFRRIIEEEVDSSLTARAFYALAQLERQQGRGAEADRLERTLRTRYPSAPIVAQLAGEGVDEPAAADTTRLDEAYAGARGLWRSGRYRAATDSFLTIVARAPESEVAPRAMLAAVMSHLDQPGADTLGLDRPVTDSLPSSFWLRLGFSQDTTLTEPTPRRLLRVTSGRYGQSPAGERARSMLAAIAALRPDSLSADSTGVDSLGTVPAPSDSALAPMAGDVPSDEAPADSLGSDSLQVRPEAVPRDSLRAAEEVRGDGDEGEAETIIQRRRRALEAERESERDAALQDSLRKARADSLLRRAPPGGGR